MHSDHSMPNWTERPPLNPMGRPRKVPELCNFHVYFDLDADLQAFESMARNAH